MQAKAKFMNIDGPHLYDLGVPLDFDIKREFPLEKGLEVARWAFPKGFYSRVFRSL